MSLTDAMTEAYTTQPVGEVVYETLELNHATFENPYRVVTGTDVDQNLPLTLGGDPVPFTATQISVTPPGMGPDGPVPLKVSIDNVAGSLWVLLRAAIQSTNPITVIYRAYTTTDLTQPGEVFSGLELRSVDLGPTSADGTLNFREIELQAFPLPTYDETYYPTLQNN